MARNQGNYDRAWAFAEFGGRKLSAGQSSAGGETFIAVAAVGGDLTVNITASAGDNLTGLVVKDGTTFIYPIASLSVDGGSAGYAVAYLAK